MTVRGVIDLGTDRVKQVLCLLGNPEQRIARKQIVHITGTNGKGSTVEMIATGLAALGNKVGVFTSPFLIHESDSIRIFNQGMITDIPEKELMHLKEKAGCQSSTLSLTDFEALFVAACIFFSSQTLDVAVIEVGMGGRDDATNVFQSICPPIISVLTGVSLDHEKFLGPTIEDICHHKCGIVQEGSLFVVSSNIDESCKKIVNKRVNDMHATVQYVSGHHDIISPLNGAHQRLLTAIAVAVISAIESHVSNDDVLKAVASTKLPGRLERRFDNPIIPFPIILDGAHNTESAIALRHFIDSEVAISGQEKIVWIIATSYGREGIVPILVQDTDDVLFIGFKSFSNTANWVRDCNPAVLSDQLPSDRRTGATITLTDQYIADALCLVSKRPDLDKCLVVIAGSLYLVRNYLIYLIENS